MSQVLYGVLEGIIGALYLVLIVFGVSISWHLGMWFINTMARRYEMKESKKLLKEVMELTKQVDKWKKANNQG